MQVLIKFVEGLLELQSAEDALDVLEPDHMQDVAFCIYGQSPYRCKTCSKARKSWIDLNPAIQRAFPQRDLNTKPFPSFLGSSTVSFRE